MVKYIGKLFVILLFTCWAGSAKAAVVTLNGVEWQQPDSFDSSSWNDISAVCDYISGACNGSLHGIDLTGWTWASVDDLNDLFNAYYSGIPSALVWENMGPGPDVQGNSDTSFWAPNFGGSGFQVSFSGYEDPPGVFVTAWAGWLRGEVAGFPDRGYLGGVTDFDWGIFLPQQDDRIYTGSQQFRQYGLDGWGGWFFRELDTDNDGVPDIDDAYPNISLDGRLDTDSDGIPNDCDAACINLGMLADDDDDGDGHIDTADNCPLIANPDQLDDNNDGIGNLCQPPGCS